MNSPCRICIVQAICQDSCDEAKEYTKKLIESFDIKLDYKNAPLNGQCLKIISDWVVTKQTRIPHVPSLICDFEGLAMDLIVNMEDGEISFMELVEHKTWR